MTENVVQAIARDCLAETLRRLEVAGHQTVMHIHDEAVLDTQATLEEITDLMGEGISWAPGLPLKADGFITSYYMKD